MADPPVQQRLRGLVLSATDLRQMIDWPDALVEDYLNILTNLNLISELLDSEIDKKIEDTETAFTDGSVPFVKGGFLSEDNANFFWDLLNKILHLGNDGDNSADRESVISFNFEGTDGASIDVVRPAGGTAADTFIRIHAGGDFVNYAIKITKTLQVYFSTKVGIRTENPQALLDVLGDARFGDSLTNYLALSTIGAVSFKGKARINWTKITANTITLSVGTSVNSVNDLRSANDGNVYDLVEAAATPGQSLIIHFINVTAFNWVKILLTYEGLATHALTIELYNWNTAAWDHFNSAQTAFSDTGTIFEDKSFFVSNDSNYIGTGLDLGKVDVRIEHPMAGNAAHNTYLDEVSLQQ